MAKKHRIILLAALVGAALALWTWWSRDRERSEPGILRVSGNLELTEVQIAFKIHGRLAELQVREGDAVTQGQLIARLDQAELLKRRESALAALAASRSLLAQLETAVRYRDAQVEAGVARAAAELKTAESRLAALEAGSRTQEIEEARAALDRATTEWERASRDWERAQTLFGNEDISTQQHDEFRARFETARALRAQAEQRLALVREGPRKEDIASGRAQVEAARANLELAEAGRLDLKRVRQEIDTRKAEIDSARAQLDIIEEQVRDAVAVSPVDGIVLVKSAEPGEVLAAGTAVVTVGDLARPWLRAYIAETDLGRVKLGAPAKITTDSYPGKVYEGKVTFIASDAEFTPKQIQTGQERVKLVYRIKIDVSNEHGELKSNMPADAEIGM